MESLIGKHLTVRGPFGRDQAGRKTSQVIEVGGKCQYIGPNEILGYDLVVVLDRMPLVLSHVNQIIKVL